MRVLIIGVGGQDGSYLRELLFQEGEEVFGIRSPERFAQNLVIPESCIEPEILKIKNDNIDCSDRVQLLGFLDNARPDVIIHLAAIHSHSSGMSGLLLNKTLDMEQVHLLITQNILFWLERNLTSRLFISLSSQMYSAEPSRVLTINEESLTKPQNYYGTTKYDSWVLAKQFRDEQGALVSAGILFNHTSPRSRPGFLFDTIAKQLIEVQKGKTKEIRLRDSSALIDITHAREVVDCIWKIVNLTPAADFVVGSGRLVSISEVIKESCLDLGITDMPRIISTDQKKVNGYLVSDISKAKSLISWQPTITARSILSEICIYLAEKNL